MKWIDYGMYVLIIAGVVCAMYGDWIATKRRRK
jgi:hypothetical protein